MTDEPIRQRDDVAVENKATSLPEAEITRMTDDAAEFLFFGWNSAERRGKTQAYAVRLGDSGDMRVAVVRRMIAIIRDHERGDFRWQSWRLGRIVVLSARLEDGPFLENFMLQEFFEARSASPAVPHAAAPPRRIGVD